MAITKDTILSQIPDHIIENHPRFYEFLEAYYEWMNQDGNPYQRVKAHMDYLTFKQSLSDYTDMMKKEYLTDVPDAILLDKELFIKWSRKFNLARGSKASYKFLFRVLFGENTTDIYRPKDNILKLSDGDWIAGENAIIVTNSGNATNFLYKRIFQEREIGSGIFEYAYATVQRVKSKYSGRYNLTELIVTDVDGEFEEGYPIKTVDGHSEWLIPTVSTFDISSAGSGYNQGQRIELDGFSSFSVERTASVEGEFDTRITSYLQANDISVTVDSVPVTGFIFDGRTIYHEDVSLGSEVAVTFPSYNGYIIIDSVDDGGAVTNIEILDTIIGGAGGVGVTWSNFGSGLSVSSNRGFVKPVKSYYSNTKGHLSSNMYLQDSLYYQNYSYAIKTQQDISKYEDIVGKILHPAGFLMFGNLTILSIIEMLISYHEDSDVYVLSTGVDVVPKYELGPNYSFIDRAKGGWSSRLYKMSHLYPLDVAFITGETGGEDYNLQSVFLFENTPYEYTSKKGWMNRFNWCDYDLYIPQEYVEEDESGNTYFESGYVSERD